MTLLLSWIGRDPRKISSFYIASDSRFSWGNPINYDYGRKVYSLKHSPDILGYCGDVLYPTIVLNQIMDMDANNILFPPNADNKRRSEVLFQEITRKFSAYPSQIAMNGPLEIIHVSRSNEADFSCQIYSWTAVRGWTVIEQEIPDSSDKVIILGSGKDEFYKRYLEYHNSLNGKTSRAIFQCLCHTLFKIKDPNCGGSPQLVGLYNQRNGNTFGVIYDNKRFFLGRELPYSDEINNIEWRNELFERCDGISTKILSGAQRQPDSLRS